MALHACGRPVRLIHRHRCSIGSSIPSEAVAMTWESYRTRPPQSQRAGRLGKTSTYCKAPTPLSNTARPTSSGGRCGGSASKRKALDVAQVEIASDQDLPTAALKKVEYLDLLLRDRLVGHITSVQARESRTSSCPSLGYGSSSSNSSYVLRSRPSRLAVIGQLVRNMPKRGSPERLSSQAIGSCSESGKATLIEALTHACSRRSDVGD